LHEILSEMGQTTAERGSLWARFKRWLRTLLEQSDRDRDEGWLDRMISRAGFSQAMIELITYAALGLVVALALVILANEVRASGILRRARWQARAQSHGLAASGNDATLQDLERASLPDKPRVLLGLLAQRLTMLGLLPPARALTVQEMTRTVQSIDAADRTRLAELAAASEHVRYAQTPVAVETIDGVVARGRELLARLDERALATRQHVSV
jgi:hypothetical protein